MRTLLEVRSWIAQPTSSTLMTICPLESNPRFDQILPKKWKNWSEKWVGLDEKMVLWLPNFGHSLSSSYYTIYVLRSKIRPNLTKKVKKSSRKMSGARWKNGHMTPKLWPWPILIILHDICVAIKNSFFSGAFKTRQVNTVECWYTY